jgi:hypothetical protein
VAPRWLQHSVAGYRFGPIRFSLAWTFEEAAATTIVGAHKFDDESEIVERIIPGSLELLAALLDDTNLWGTPEARERLREAVQDEQSTHRLTGWDQLQYKLIMLSLSQRSQPITNRDLLLALCRLPCRARVVLRRAGLSRRRG